MPEKRKYTRRKKSLGAAGLEGFTDGVTFATERMNEKDGAAYLAGHQQGMAFAMKNAPAQKKRKYTRRKKAGAKKPGPKPGSRRKSKAAP